MHFISFIVVLWLSTAVSLCSGNSLPLKDLKFATVLYRHGDRTPIDHFKTDPYKDRAYWGTGPGQLTAKGKRMHYELGQFLRKRYNGFLNQSYDEREIYVRSTDVDRTLMSAMSNLAGLYPPSGDQIWNKDINWQPIPVHTRDKDKDFLLNQLDCPSLIESYNDTLFNDPTFKALNEKYDWLYKYVSNHTGTVVDNALNLEYIFDTLTIESSHNYTLPKWTRQAFPDPMLELVNVSFILHTWTHEMKRLRMGPLIKELIEDWLKKMNNESDDDMTKFVMYSAHDTTVSNLLNSLGMFNFIPPPYASCIIMELYKPENSPAYVQFLFRNDTSVPPYPLILPGCQERCPLMEFIRLTKNLVPADWKSECNPDQTIALVSGFSGFIGILLLLIFILSVIVSLGRKCCRSSQRNTEYFSLNQDNGF